MATMSIEQKLSPAHVGHASTRDQADHTSGKVPLLDYLRYAQRRSGRPPTDLALEFFRLTRGCGKLTFPEYVQFGIYDTTRYSPDEQARFLSGALHWPLTHVCCDMSWEATTEDKWLSSHIVSQSGIRVPETLAVIDKTERIYPGMHKISTAQQLRDFMRSKDLLPLFGKENRGMCSHGAFLAEDADESGILLKGRGRIGYDTCIDEFVGATPYLLQRVERNHSFFHQFTTGLSTVRVCILMDKAGIKIPFAVLKIPSRENVADNFWRSGNLACGLDVESGKIQTVRSSHPMGTTDHETHPETGAPVLGQTLPMWNRVLELVHRCAPIFQPVRYQSMDIAIAQEGPVLVEINTGGSYELLQLATGKGFLTDEVREFLRYCGYRKV